MFFKKSKMIEKRHNNSKPKIALLRGKVLEKRNTREMELLTDYFDIVAFGTPITENDRKTITLPIRELKIKEIDYPSADKNIFKPFRTQMVGLEDELADFDLIFTGDSFYQMSYQAIEAKKRHGIKVMVLQNENIPFNFNREGQNNIHKKVIENADHFIAIADCARETLILEGVPENKITVIPWGIDLNRYNNIEDVAKEEFAARYNISQDTLNMLFVGRLDWSKGVFDIVYAAKKLSLDPALKGKKIKFIFVGNGPDRTILERQANLLGIKEKICFCGTIPLNTIELAYLASDILLAPSIPTPNIREQFGQVLIEGMAAGLPIITTSVGAIPEVVGDAAVLIPPADYKLLYLALKRLILNEGERLNLGKMAKERAKEKFDINKVALRLRNTIETVLNGNQQDFHPAQTKWNTQKILK